MEFGINLFSVRNLIQTEKGLIDTLIKLKEAGYSYAQFSGASFDAKTIKKAVDESGMPVYLTHVPMDRIVGDTEKLMEEHAYFGCKNIGLGMMKPVDVLFDEKLFKETADKLNSAGEKMAKSGFKFFYHHHHFEFYKLNGRTAFKYMVENAPFINFTLDTYWLQYGGADIVSTVKFLKDRIDCVHLKDYKISKEFNPVFASVGDGNLDFMSIIKTMKDVGVKYYFVEQDNASELSDGFDQVVNSAKFLKENF